MKQSASFADQYSTVIEYVLIATGILLLVLGTLAPSATKTLVFAFMTWLGLNAFVFVWLVLRVSGGPN